MKRDDEDGCETHLPEELFVNGPGDQAMGHLGLPVHQGALKQEAHVLVETLVKSRDKGHSGLVQNAGGGAAREVHQQHDDRIAP